MSEFNDTVGRFHASTLNVWMVDLDQLPSFKPLVEQNKTKNKKPDPCMASLSPSFATKK